MDVSKTEMTIIEAAVQSAEQCEVLQLNELQLALVGGGMGDTINA